MEAVILVGLQGSGKSTFYKQRFAGTHIHISLDVLKTRKQEKRVLEIAIQSRQNFVIDNTNPTAREREEYIRLAKAAGYVVRGYYFDCTVEECLKRNELRLGKARVPRIGLFAARKKLQIPNKIEGFNELFVVRPNLEAAFSVMPMPEPFEPLAFTKATREGAE